MNAFVTIQENHVPSYYFTNIKMRFINDLIVSFLMFWESKGKLNTGSNRFTNIVTLGNINIFDLIKGRLGTYGLIKTSLPGATRLQK